MDADSAIRELLLAALTPESTIFTDHVSHLCEAYRHLGGIGWSRAETPTSVTVCTEPLRPAPD
jgi:hypothetical protein